jgi:hypothetical protein
VEKQAFSYGFYADADGLPDGSEYPAEGYVLSFVAE